jgi:hypothetical protein
MGQEHLSGIRQAYEATGPIKERDSALVLESFDLLADSRLCEMQMGRRRGKTGVRCHFLEGDELT